MSWSWSWESITGILELLTLMFQLHIHLASSSGKRLWWSTWRVSGKSLDFTPPSARFKFLAARDIMSSFWFAKIAVSSTWSHKVGPHRLLHHLYTSSVHVREVYDKLLKRIESRRCIICKNKVYILSVPTPGKPLNCGTALSADNFFIKDLVSRVRPNQPGMLTQK